MFIKSFHEFKQLPLKTDSSHVMLHMEAPSILDKGLPPKNFLFVIDTSSSMSGEKLKQCKELITKGMRLFRPCDKIALISYSDGVVVHCDFTLCDDKGKKLLNKHFHSLRAHGCTNISGALFKALSLAMKQPDVTIVFLTDGLANRGITDHEELLTMTKKIVSDGMNVRIHTIGVGEDHSVDMLQQICLEGTYTYVETPESTTKAFGSILGSAYSTVFQNLKVEISGKNMNFVDGFGQPLTQYDIGDLYAEEKRDLLAKASYAKEGPYEVTWKLSGINIVDKNVLDKTVTITIERGEDNTRTKEIADRLEVIDATNKMEKAVAELEKGNVKTAKAVLLSIHSNDPILSRAMAAAEESVDMVDNHTRGMSHGVNRVKSIQHELVSQRGTSDNMSTPWQKKIERGLTDNSFTSLN